MCPQPRRKLKTAANTIFVSSSMGACKSKPPLTPNPYAPRNVVESSELVSHQESFLKGQGDDLTKPNSKDAAYGVKMELDKSFGLSKKFESTYEVGEEVGPGRFAAMAKRGKVKGQKVAVKILPKAKMTTAIATEGVRREVKILRALKGHPNVVEFHEAFEDEENVYIVTELCEGGNLLDRLLSRGGKFSEDEAKTVIVQILDFIACLHLQGVVHRDVKPENLMFASKDENSQLKFLDFGSSVFGKPDRKLDDVFGDKYYVAPEVLQRSYRTEADVWSIGVITYVLLCGSHPFWARTEPETYGEVLNSNSCFNEEEDPWPSLSPESKAFMKWLLNEDPCRRLSAAQALCHPWLRNHKPLRLPIDIHIFRCMKAYMRSSPLRKAAFRALSKTLSEEGLFYLRQQFARMRPESDEARGITAETITRALVENRADAIEESNVINLLGPLKILQFRKMYFEEFSAAATSIHLLDENPHWERRAHHAFEVFEKEGNRVIIIEELTSELKLSPRVSVQAAVQEWIRGSDGKLSFHGFLKLLSIY